MTLMAIGIASGGDPLAGHDLLTALRQGGYVILMRHAHAPSAPPDSADADAENIQRERQLDEVGRRTARAMGEALQRLQIPIGPVLSSPTYRALETVKLAQLGPASTWPQLGDSGQSMRSDASGIRAAWLRVQAAQPPSPGRNTIIVTHGPNILEAYPQGADGLADGEALILRPDGQGHAPIVARLKIEDWAALQ